MDSLDLYREANIRMAARTSGIDLDFLHKKRKKNWIL